MSPLSEFEIDYSSGLPTWIQLKNRIIYLIGSGAYEVGDRLPTCRGLAVDLDISYNTVNRAYMDLERDGYINTRRGRGTFVAQREASSDDCMMDAALELLVDDMITACTNAGMTEADIVRIVEGRLAARKGKA